MAEHRFSFTPAEMDTLKGVIDYAVQRIDERTGSAHVTPTDLMALRLSRVHIVKLRSKIFPAISAVADISKAKVTA